MLDQVCTLYVHSSLVVADADSRTGSFVCEPLLYCICGWVIFVGGPFFLGSRRWPGWLLAPTRGKPHLWLPHHTEGVYLTLQVDAGSLLPAQQRIQWFHRQSGHPNQTERVTSDHEARAVRRRANTPRTHQARADPDTMSDVHGGHARTMSYVRRGSRMWRRPSTKERVPVERRP